MKRKFIPLSVPNLKGNELKYVTEAIETEWVSTGGPYVNEFETKIAEYVNVKGAVSCQNGTSGLHISLQLCGVSSNNEVIVPTLTFIAAVNPVKYIGASPVFMDCDDSLCLDPIKLEEFCLNHCNFENAMLINKETKKHINALVVVHVFGNMADMEKIMNIASKYNLKVIEDATEALGTRYISGKYKNEYAGTIGDIGVYSFNGNKIMTTGGGGMIVSNNLDYIRKAKHLTTQAKSNELYYTHDEIGYNYRMTNLQAALGIAQLEKLDDFIITKKKNFDYYTKLLSNIKHLSLLNFRSNTRPNYWFYALLIGDQFAVNRDKLISYFSSREIQVRPIWGLISDQIPYLDYQKFKIERANFFIQRVINIPCSTNLNLDDIEYIVSCITDIEKGE